MTYGWMLLVVAIVGGAIFSVAQSESVDTVSGMEGEDAYINDFGVTSDGELGMDVQNRGSNSIVVSEVNVTDPDTGEWVQKEFTTDSRVGVGSDKIFQIPNVTRTDGANTLNVEIVYDSGGLENLSATGTITGNLQLTESRVSYEGSPEQHQEGVEAPTAVADVDESNPEEDETVEFTASDSAEGRGSITSYNWDFSDGNTATGETVTHSYTNEGEYTAQLTIEDENGEEDTDSVTVDVEEPTESTTVLYTFEEDQDNVDTESSQFDRHEYMNSSDPERAEEDISDIDEITVVEMHGAGGGNSTDGNSGGSGGYVENVVADVSEEDNLYIWAAESGLTGSDNVWGRYNTEIQSILSVEGTGGGSTEISIEDTDVNDGDGEPFIAGAGAGGGARYDDEEEDGLDGYRQAENPLGGEGGTGGSTDGGPGEGAVDGHGTEVDIIDEGTTQEGQGADSQEHGYIILELGTENGGETQTASGTVSASPG